MTQSINTIQDEIIKEFQHLKEWFDKYEYLIHLGKTLPSNKTIRTQKNSISGCQSQVWLQSKKTGENIHFIVDSDTIITKGILSLLLRVIDNQTPQDILNTDFYFLDKIGLRSHLSPSRAQGLASIENTIKTSAQNAKT